ncbi:MAG: hypothetical protein IJH13_01340, partial [Bacilli bacterium]|nr:hypothetical protein [Bacilli bacterium]
MPKKKLRLYTKIFFCIVYLLVMGILFFSAYKLYMSDKKEVAWDKVISTTNKTSLTISKMSEAFAKIDNKQIHFVIVEDKNKVYRSYLIAISKKDYKKYKPIIDYSYERTKEKQKPLIVKGYPQIISNKLKELTLKNYKNFLPNDNKVKLNEKNFDKYMTNTYLDTTIKKVEKTNYIVITLLVLIVLLFILLLLTLIDRDMIVNKASKALEKEQKK